MMGINVNAINNAINKNNMYYESINDDAQELVANLNDLSNLYSGNDLQFLFQDLIGQINNVKLIPSVVNSYTEVLRGVQTSYKAQDINLKDQVNHMSSKANM